MEAKSCISCGMPIRSESDAAAGDLGKDYCHHCARPDGSMKSFDEVHSGMTQFIIKTQGLDESVASGLARQMMKKQPAWRDSD